MPSDYAIVKNYFRNAFNSVRRDRMLEAVPALDPDIYHLVNSAYSSSHLFWGDHRILSAEGVQQGDLLGPLDDQRQSRVYHVCRV